MTRIDPNNGNAQPNFGCSCVCNVNKDNRSSGKSWAWVPFFGGGCGCACNGTAVNKSANKSQAKNS